MLVRSDALQKITSLTLGFLTHMVRTDDLLSHAESLPNLAVAKTSKDTDIIVISTMSG